MSKTPRTDENVFNSWMTADEVVYVDFARELEKELLKAKELLGYASKRLYQLAKTNNDYILVERINNRLESEANE